MAQYDGSIKIDTKIDTKNATSQIMTLENRIVKTADKIAALRSKMDSLKDVQIPTQEYKSIETDIAKAETELGKLIEKQSQMQNEGKDSGAAWDRLNQRIQASKDYIKIAKEEMQQLVNEGKAFTLGEDTEEYAKLGQQLKYAENEMSVLNQRHNELIAKQSKEISLTDRLKRSFSNVKGAILKVVSAVKKMSLAGKKSFNGINGPVTRNISTMLKYAFGIRSLFALFRKLRSAATESLKAMGQKFPEIQKDLNNLKSAFTGFKASIGTAFQPLLAAAAPVLTTIINLATQAANAIGSLFAALTGQKYVYKATAANNAYADSVSGAGKAAKEANKYLAEYDDLMVIQSNSDSTGSGGGGGGAGSEMDWEKVPVDQSIQNLADKIKQAWKDADFFDIGKEIGGKIKEKLDNIDWDGVKESAYKAGKSLATFLNGIFASDVLESVGTTIGESLNTAVQSGLGFVENFDWKENGKKIASGINRLIDTFDVDDFAKLLYTTIKGALDLSIEFFKEADFEKLGEKVGTFLKNMTEEIPEITVKIGKLTWEIAKDAAGFVAGVNETNPFLVDLMAMLGIAKLGAVPGLQIPLLLIAVAKIGWDLGKTIYENLSTDEDGMNIIDHFVKASGIGELALDIADVFEDIGSDGIEGFWKGFTKALNGIKESVKKWIQDYIVEPWKDVLGIHSPSTVLAEIGKNVIEGFKQGILNAVSSIEQWMNNNIITPILNAWNKVKELTSTVKGKVDESFTNLKTVWDNLPSIKDLLANAKGKIEDSFANLKSSWDSLVATTKELIAEGKAKGIDAINKLSNAWDTLKSGVSNVVKSAVGKASGKSAITSITNAWKKLLNSKSTQTLTAKFKDMFTAPLKSAWNALASKVNDAIVTINKIPGVNITGRVPKLAQGAVIPPNREFLAVLGDQKNGVNIETPLQTMIEAFNKALDMRGEESSSKEPIILQLNGRDIAAVVWDEDEKRYKQTGRHRYGYA